MNAYRSYARADPAVDDLDEAMDAYFNAQRSLEARVRQMSGCGVDEVAPLVAGLFDQALHLSDGQALNENVSGPEMGCAAWISGSDVVPELRATYPAPWPEGGAVQAGSRRMVDDVAGGRIIACVYDELPYLCR
jgi:hypothetical protein